LSEAPGRRIRMSDLAEIAMLSKSRLSHRITVMEKAGWVKREACKEDRRGAWAVMTDKGLKAIIKAAPDHVDSVRTRFLDRLDGEDQINVAEVFEEVLTGLRSEFKSERDERG